MTKKLGFLILFLGLAGCGGDNPPREMPRVPVNNVLETASHPAFRSINAESFRQAVVLYPADDGHHRVPVGDYLATRIAEAFPRNAEVTGLTLERYDAACRETGFLSSGVECGVAAAFSFRLWRAPNRVRFQLSEIDLGDLNEVDEGAYRVGDYGAADPFTRQLRGLVDVTAAKFKRELNAVLVAMNRRQAF